LQGSNERLFHAQDDYFGAQVANEIEPFGAGHGFADDAEVRTREHGLQRGSARRDLVDDEDLNAAFHSYDRLAAGDWGGVGGAARPKSVLMIGLSESAVGLNDWMPVEALVVSLAARSASRTLQSGWFSTRTSF